MVDFTIEHLDLAGCAQAMAARVRQPDSGAQGGIEDGLVFFHLDGFAQRFDRQFIAHDCVLSICQGR